MPWPGFKNFLMGCPRPEPEDPYMEYLRSNNRENRERRRCSIQPAPLMEHNEWSRRNGQAVAAWDGQIMERHNRDLGTTYRNWDDFEAAKVQSTRRDQNIRENMRRRRVRRTEPNPFFGGPGQPRNRFAETDEEWYARMIDPGSRRRETYDIWGNDFVGSGAEDFGRRRGHDLGTRGGISTARGANTAGWTGQSRGQKEHISRGDAAGNMRSNNIAGQDEAEAFVNSSHDGRTSGNGDGDWKDEAQAFLHPRR